MQTIEDIVYSAISHGAGQELYKEVGRECGRIAAVLADKFVSNPAIVAKLDDGTVDELPVVVPPSLNFHDLPLSLLAVR